MTATHQNREPRTPKRTVIIGAHGFIGAAIRRVIESRSWPLVALTSADVDLAAPSAGDTLRSLLRADDAVVMLAALTPDKGKDIATLMRNLAMMQHLCAALENIGCAHLVYVSSDAVYDLAVSPIDEATPASPRDLYGVMHYSRELMASGLKNTPLLVLRPTLVYGLDDTHNSYGANRFRRAAERDGRIELFGGGEETRDHIHVDDVAELAVQCLLRRTIGLLNAATGMSHTFREVAEIVARQFDRKIEITEVPRVIPITHRRFGVRNLTNAFPSLRFKDLETGIALVHRAAVASGS